MAVNLDEIMSRASDAIAALRRKAPVRAAYLFGSHVDGRAHTDSDIDVGVFVKGAERWGIHRVAKVSALVQREAGDDIELHIFPASKLGHAEPASFAAYVQEHGMRVPIDDDE